MLLSPAPPARSTRQSTTKTHRHLGPAIPSPPGQTTAQQTPHLTSRPSQENNRPSQTPTRHVTPPQIRPTNFNPHSPTRPTQPSPLPPIIRKRLHKSLRMQHPISHASACIGTSTIKQGVLTCQQCRLCKRRWEWRGARADEEAGWKGSERFRIVDRDPTGGV